MARLVIGTDKSVKVPAVVVEKTTPEPYLELEVNSSNKLVHSTTTSRVVDIKGATDLDSWVLNRAYQGNLSISGVIDFSSLKKISGNAAINSVFSGCQNITGVLLSSLETVTGANSVLGQAFSSSGITFIDIGRLVNASGGNGIMVSMCTGTKLEKVYFYSLKRLSSAANPMVGSFGNINTLTDIYFNALTTTFSGKLEGMLNSNTDVKLHFPKNLDPQTGSTTISGLSGYPNFGGTNTVVLFDLPSTVVLTGANLTEYERNPKYDTQTALAWRVKDTGYDTEPIIDWTPFYTSGTTDPTVGTTIYSDASCTTAVTTVASIA